MVSGGRKRIAFDGRLHQENVTRGDAIQEISKWTGLRLKMRRFKMTKRKAWVSAARTFAPAMNPRADMLNYRRQQTETDVGGGCQSV